MFPRQTFTRSQPTTISEPSLFLEEVVTRLPYHVATRPMKERFHAYMIDEERIVGLKVCPMHGRDEMLTNGRVLRQHRMIVLWSYTYTHFEWPDLPT